VLISVGIDVGSKNGAIAVIDEELNILHLDTAPYKLIELAHTANNRLKPRANKETGKLEFAYKSRAWTDYTQLRSIFEPYINNDIIYTIERVSVRPGEGEISSFVFGNSLGCFQGLSAYLNPIKIYEPTPIIWKNEMGVTSEKETSIELAESIFETNLKSYKAKGKIDDIAEALLLAIYGFKMYDSECSNGR
jgi:hypothetical protein